MAQALPTTPEMDRRMKVFSVYHSNAEEIQGKPHLLLSTYDFSRASSWHEVGLQALSAAGLRPDCSLGAEINVERSLPPRNKQGHIIVEPNELMTAFDATTAPGYQHWISDPLTGVCVTTCVFFQEGIGASCASQIGAGRLPCVQGWNLGVDETSTDPPDFLIEAGMLHALLLAEQYIISVDEQPRFFRVKTGKWRLCAQDQQWLNTGVLTLTSPAASDAEAILHRLDGQLQCPPILAPALEGYFENINPRGIWDCDLIATAARRLYSVIASQTRNKYGS